MESPELKLAWWWDNRANAPVVPDAWIAQRTRQEPSSVLGRTTGAPTKKARQNVTSVAPTLLFDTTWERETDASAPCEPGKGGEGSGMGYRIFRDSAGTEWQTWDVVPRLAERRVSDRRMTVSVAPGMERRRVEDRRIRQGARPTLTSGLGGGWLCFEALLEKRRLCPIPDDWERCPTPRLEEYCRSAKPAMRIAGAGMLNRGR